MAKYSFDIQGIEAWEGATKQKSLKVVRASFRELAGRIIDDAPVDTGFMVASARVRINPKRSLKIQERPPKYSRPDAREMKKQEVYAHSVKTYLGDTLGLTFVANYTGYVHNGTSKQAAQPFISINLSAWPSIVRTMVARHKKG